MSLKGRECDVQNRRCWSVIGLLLTWATSGSPLQDKEYQACFYLAIVKESSKPHKIGQLLWV